jgi:long-subunit acyl-CoA synthetase (AMP-forming)
MSTSALILDHVYDHEAQLASRTYLTQPLGQGRVADYSWAQVLDQSRRMAAHLQGLGLPRGARIAILSKNCAHFIMAELAIWMAGHTTVAIFPTETAETIGYVLGHSEASLLFVGKLDTWQAQKPGVSAALPRIAFPLAPDSALKDYEGWDAIIARTAPLGGRPQRTADELAMIIYTSGSTGRPKGAMVSFGAISNAAVGIVGDLRKRLGESEDGRILSYLPLAHSFERSWVEAASLVDGKTHVFFAESLDTFLQDLQRARPTMFISVPRLWLKFQQGVFAKMPPEKLDRLLGIPLLGRIVAKKVLKGLGLDAVRQAGSGSAPLPPELIRWYRRLGLKLFEGYGMTEDNSYSHSSNEQFAEPGYVGVAQPGVQVRISPEGEIQIKSPGQFSGYYKQPELTAESFTEDGFFRTGDRGELRADGLLKITGRTKELFKTAKGKYVAPAPIEDLLVTHPAVEACVVTGANFAQPLALLMLSLEAMAAARGDGRSVLVQSLETHLKTVNSRLDAHEKLDCVAVVTTMWTPENGFVTPTLKVKRARIEEAYAGQYEGWIRERKTVVWAEV